MKSLDALGYTSAREALAEKFHMSEALLSALNPGKKFDRAGETIFVADVLKAAAEARDKPDRGRQDKADGQGVRPAGRAGRLLSGNRRQRGKADAERHAQGRLHRRQSEPIATTRTTGSRGSRSKRPFTIKPGPNNPAGAYWIGLSAEGYGIHGTPDPSKVSKTESHGCVRLTNWDAVLLGSNVKKGTPVEFVEGKNDETS